MSTTDTSPSTGKPQSRAGGPAPDARGFWRVLLAVVAPLPPLALAAAALLVPYPLEAETDVMLADAAADPGALRIVVWLNLLFLVTTIPAIVAVVWVCRRRSPRLTAAGALLSLLGFGAASALPNGDLVSLAVVQQGVDRAAVVALDEAIWGQPVMLAVLLIFLPGMTIGAVLLGIALWRGRVGPRWMALALIVSGPLRLAPAGGLNAVAALGWALAAVGYAAATLGLLRMSNDEFDLPPISTTRSGSDGFAVR